MNTTYIVICLLVVGLSITFYTLRRLSAQPVKYDIATAKVGDLVQPPGLALIHPYAWVVTGFVICNGRRIKTIIQHPISKDTLALEFI